MGGALLCVVSSTAFGATFESLSELLERDPSARACAVKFLGELGWNVTPGSNETIDVHVGSPCTRESVSAAKAAGDLRVSLPTGSRVDALGREALVGLLQSDGTRCAFAFRYGDATRAATRQLARNPGYRFSGPQLGWVKVRGDAWSRKDVFGRWYEPARSSAAALRVFTAGKARSDCGVGRQVAQYVTLAELFGDDFDRTFAANEVVIGTFNKLNRSNSVLLGAARGELEADGLGRRAASLGRQAYAGMPGFLFAVEPEALSDTSNQAQNFVVVDVDSAAGDSLRAADGFAHYNDLFRRIWMHARSIGDLGNRGYERLLLDRRPRSWSKLSHQQQSVAREMLLLLDDPFFAGFQVYVHPKGIRPIGYHVVRMLDRNLGTPYRIELARNNVHREVFARYALNRIEACRAQVSSRAPVQ